MLDAITIAFLALLISSLSLVATIFLFYWGKKWEYSLIYRVDYIKRTFQETLTRIKEYDNNVNKYFKGKSARMDAYAYIDNIKKDGGFGIIKRIDKELYDSMNIVSQELNPKIIELMELRGDLDRKIINDWTLILQSKGTHKGVNENSLARSLYDECVNDILMGDLDIISKKFDEVMERLFKSIGNYQNNPYPPITIENFKDVVKKYYQEYKSRLDEVKKLKENNIDKIIIPKMEEKIQDPL